MRYFSYLSVNYGLLLWLIIRIYQSIMDYENYALFIKVRGYYNYQLIMGYYNYGML